MISIIIPFHNEEDNLKTLHQEIETELEKQEHEIIFVNDGSTDGSEAKMSSLTSRKNVRLISHNKRLGKGRALLTGFRNSRGNITIFMDADLQDDPKDLSLFLQKIYEGYDVVNGWRKNRRDKRSMSLLSKVGNVVIWKTLLGSHLHDVNCGFKAFRREILEEIPLYGDNFRFVPLIAEQKGYKVGEVIVNNRVRVHGKSKYNLTKAIFGLFDTLTTYFIFRFSEKPLHFFGIVGGAFLGLGSFITLILVVQRLFFGVLLYRRPALQFALLFIIVGIQIVMTGILAELLVYLNKKSKK